MKRRYLIININQVTPAWLTKLLQEKGYIHRGAVTQIQIVKSVKQHSTLYHLIAGYSTATKPRSVPTRFVLKIPHSDSAWASKEVEFYHTIVPLMLSTHPANDLPLLRCYDAVYSAATQQSHLLLEDVSSTHFTTAGQMPPTPDHCQQVIEAYALFHAYWWEHPRLGQDIGELLTEETIDSFLTGIQAKFRAFMDLIGARLANIEREVLEAVVSTWPMKRRQRLVRGKGVTLVHRDPHPLNFLYPHDPTQSKVKLIDWQSWRVDTGTDDLAYLMACHWPLEQRAPIERDLIRHYHRRLVGLGVANYSWADCWYDYRASIIRCLFFLMFAFSPSQLEDETWWDRVKRGLEAFQDWDCTDLLQ